MELVGYCEIKKDASTGMGNSAPIDDFLGKTLRVMEFDSEGGVLVMNSAATSLCMFDACDVRRSFKCSAVGEHLTPPGLNMIEQTIYIAKLMNRKGGFNQLLKNMLIQASLMKGTFSDSFLFSMENHPEYKNQD